MFISKQLLIWFNLDQETILKTDSSRYYASGMLIQVQDDSMLYPYAFFLKKNSLAKYNYEIYNKEMLAII